MANNAWCTCLRLQRLWHKKGGAAFYVLGASALLCTHLAGLQVLSKLLPIVIAQLKSPHDLTRKKVRTTIELLSLAVVKHALIQ